MSKYMVGRGIPTCRAITLTGCAPSSSILRNAVISLLFRPNRLNSSVVIKYRQLNFSLYLSEKQPLFYFCYELLTISEFLFIIHSLIFNFILMSTQPSPDTEIDIEDPEVVNNPRARDILLGDINEFKPFPRELTELERVHLCRFLIGEVLRSLGGSLTFTKGFGPKDVPTILGDTVQPADAESFVLPLILYLHQRTRILKAIVGGRT